MKFRHTLFWKNYKEYDKVSGNSSMRCTIDAIFYWKLLQEFKFQKFLEIGVYQGLTSGLMLESNVNSQLTGIDPTLRLLNFNRFYPDSVKQRATFIEDRSQNINLNESYDFILIDGDHSFEAAKNDILKFAPLLNKHGVLAIDDYNEFGVPDAVHLLLEAGLVPFLQLEQTEFWHYPDQDRSNFLDNLLTDPVSEFIFLHNIDRFGHTVLKAKTVKLFTDNIDFFDQILDLYNI